MTKIKVCPGVCGLESVICADSEDMVEAELTVETQCPFVRKMIESIEQPISAYEVCFGKPGKGAIYDAAESLAHAACPVPSAVVKLLEVECGLALPKNVSFEFVE